MNLTARSYAPRAGSLPARVIQFFAANLSRRLSTAEIADCFDASPDSLSSNLKLALEAGFLGKEGALWCAGEDIDLAPDYGAVAAIDRTVASAATSSGAHNPFQLASVHNPFQLASATIKTTKARRAVRGPQLAAPDFSGLQIDEGIELVASVKKSNQWAPLFEALARPGQSAVISAEWRKAIKVHATARKKAGQGSYQIGIDAQGKTRILRTA